jgi:AraC-like DNA-binding protein
MLADNHLALRLIRLKSPEEWKPKRAGLSFLILKGGNGKYVVGSTAQRVASGDVLVLNEEAEGKLSASNDGEMAFWQFSLNLEHLFPLFAGIEISLLQNVVEGFKGSKLLPASTPLAVQCHRLIGEVPPQFNLDHRSQLLRVAAAILSEEFKTAQRQRPGFVRVEEHMLQVFEKLSGDELLRLSVGGLAARFGCSRRHLNRLFHQYFGFSVAALRMEMRLLKALSLLRDPDAKIILVAEQCGFNHLGLFNTCFKRRFGASPGRWRKTTAQTPSQPASRTVGDSNCPLIMNGLCPLTAKSSHFAPDPTSAAQFQKPGGARILTSLPVMNAKAGVQTLTMQQKMAEELCKPGALRIVT